MIIDDQVVRQSALDPTRSFIVQAPAGSGKTALLMQRFLVLLSTAQAPEECLAITFTRKAAFEMRERILSALMRAEDPIPPEDRYAYETWILAKKVLARSNALEWDLLCNANRLKIQTIDSLCASLIRGMPILSRLGGIPEVAEDAEGMYMAAAKGLLESLETEDAWSSAVQCLMMHLDNNLAFAQRLLADLLPYRDQWLPYIGKTVSHEEWRATLESGLQLAVEELIYAVQLCVPKEVMSDLKALAEFAAEQIKYVDADSSIAALTLARTTEINYWIGLAELLLTSEGEWRKAVTQKQGFPAPSSADNKQDKAIYQMNKDAMLALLESLNRYPDFKTRLFAIKHCPPLVYSNEQWALVEALIQLLPILSAHLNIVFQEHGKVDFTEITMAANRALGDSEAPTDLALILDTKIQHILVDEFQDTSISQFGLLQKLTAGWVQGDGRTVFLVGDPMQSIYRFRQAEVGLFLAVKKQGIQQLPIQSLTLSVNFRSDPKIIHWLNQVFSETFPKEDDISSGAIQFSSSRAHRISEEMAEFKVVPVVESNNGLEVNAVIEHIQRAKVLDPTGSIAILVRSRNHLSDILPALRQNGIAYQGVDLESLANRPVIQDLVVLTEALLHLGDRLSWLAILRCPWIDLYLSDILTLAQAAGESSLWSALSKYATLEGLTVRGQTILEHCVPILKNALMNRDRMPLRTWIWQTWTALKGHEWLYDEHCVHDVDVFLDTLDKLEDSERIKEPGVLKTYIERLYAKSTVSDPYAIQIMTIHKSKGLEFDTVILPGLGRQPRIADSPLLLWEERASRTAEQYLIFAPIKAVGQENDPIYRYLRKQKQQIEQHEALRLLYVAATRAKKRLYWIADKPLPNSLLSLVWNSVLEHFDTSEIDTLECLI